MARSALTKLRAICAAIPDYREGDHFGKLALKSGDRMFATYREDGDDCEIVFGLEPAHARELLASDSRFTAYPRVANTLVIRGSDLDDWNELRSLIEESYRLSLLQKKRRPRKRSVKRR